jgi:hypothetical protein
LAAYDAGRLVNRLKWHTQQAWLLLAEEPAQARRHAQIVQDVFRELGRVVRACVATEDRDRVQDVVKDRLADWESTFCSPGHRQGLDDALAHFQYEIQLSDGEGDPGLLREEFTKGLVRHVVALVDHTRDRVVAMLDEQRQLALGLGACVDRGVRRPDVYRFMYRSNEESKPKAKKTRAKKAPTWDDWAAASSSPTEPEPEEWYLANTSVEPGEFRPDEDWKDDVHQRWVELGLPAHFPAWIFEAAHEQAAQTISTLVEAVNAAAREALAEQPAITKPIPPEYRTKPMSLRKAARLMGFTDSKDGAEYLRAAIRDGSIRCESLTRQTHVFDKRQFPGDA